MTEQGAPFAQITGALIRHRRLFAALGFLALIAAGFRLSGLSEHFEIATLRQYLTEHQFGGLLFFVLLFSLGNLLQIPGWLFLAAAVLALGKLGGGLATYLAATVSCATTFFVVRGIGGDALREFKSSLATRLFTQLDRYPLRTVFFLRVIFQTLPIVNYALALSGVKTRHYLTGTLLGLPLPIFGYCLFFDFIWGALKI